MSIELSKLVLDEMVTRLSDAVTGFNMTYNGLAARYSQTAPMNIDFTGSSSRNFILGDVDPGDFEQTSIFKYPIVTLSTTRVSNQNFQKFTTFSGLVSVSLNVYLSWAHNNALRSFDNYPGAIEETVFTIMNTEVNQDWGPEISYNGNIDLAKSGIKRAADNWFQRMAFTLAFEVDQ